MNLLSYLTQLSREHHHAIPFERFMDEALYHPDFGYYTANIQSIGGPRGDFSTSATLHPLLAKAIAAWIENQQSPRCHRQSRESPRSRGANNESSRPSAASGCSVTLLEVGAGDGSLAKQILDALPRALRRKTRLHLVEISPPLAGLQQETLKMYRKQITWHCDMIEAVEAINDESASASDPGAPDSPVLIYSNELVDAFPPTVYEHDPAAADPAYPWKKLHLAFDPAKGIREILLPSDPPPTGNRQLSTGNSPQRIEVHESYLAWQTTWLPKLGAEGASGCNGTLPGCNGTVPLLTVDYGDTADKIYHRRPRGTLRAYHRHQRHEGPAIYARFGKQDLTADVNFSDLIHWGETQFNLKTESLQTQADFIARHLPGLTPEDPALDPQGAGSAFKILIQRG